MPEHGPFQELDPLDLKEKTINLIGREWMLITAGDKNRFNPMTASWGGLGFLWARPVAFVFVRPQRYTFELIEASPAFTLTFFDAGHHNVLSYCGSYSGRDVDKVAETGLTPVVGSTGAVYFEEARLVLECHKLYAQDLQEANFVEHQLVEQHYAARDFHRLYVGEIARVLRRPATG
jgi:flavin reductase (DIM6/NTAB) family NADH-FMN oxidoreductase RutF